MIEVAIMIEGQNGLNWKRWQRIASVVEASGYAGLFRSDHYTNATPPDLDSLDCWISLAWLATHTRRIKFGPLVSPLSFRHPTQIARMATEVDDLSEGRLILGLGAGWQEREHTNYGFELLSVKARFDRFREGLEVISRLLTYDQPVSFTGEYFNVKDAILLPRPSRPGGPPMLVGGNGKLRTLPLAARFAHEWNALFIAPDEIAILNTQLDKNIIQAGRVPQTVHRSLMTGCVFGLNQDDVDKKVFLRTKGQRTPAELRQRGMIVGTADEIVDQCQHLATIDVQRVMLQWLDLDNIAGLESMADGILGRLSD